MQKVLTSWGGGLASHNDDYKILTDGFAVFVYNTNLYTKNSGGKFGKSNGSIEVAFFMRDVRLVFHKKHAHYLQQ